MFVFLRAVAVDFSVRRKVNDVVLVDGFERRVQSGLFGPLINAFREAVPVIAGDAEHIAHLQRDLPWPQSRASFMGIDGHLLMGTLTAVVVNVVERLELGRCIRMKCLHNFIRQTTHL